MKVLVMTTEPVSVAQLRSALGENLNPDDTEVLVLAPALHESRLRFWLSDADGAIAEAEQVQRATVRGLDQADVEAHGDTGEGDPTEAIQDALVEFKADRIVVFTHAASERRYREEVDTAQIEGRFGIPVSRAELPSGQ